MNQKWGGILAGLIIMGLVIGLMARDEFLGAGWVILLVFIVPAIGRPDLWWMATLATFGSGLSMGLPGDATLHLMTMLGFVVLIAVKVAISNMRALPVSRTRKACIALLCIIDAVCKPHCRAVVLYFFRTCDDLLAADESDVDRFFSAGITAGNCLVDRALYSAW